MQQTASRIVCDRLLTHITCTKVISYNRYYVPNFVIHITTFCSKYYKIRNLIFTLSLLKHYKYHNYDARCKQNIYPLLSLRNPSFHLSLFTGTLLLQKPYDMQYGTSWLLCGPEKCKQSNFWHCKLKDSAQFKCFSWRCITRLDVRTPNWKWFE